ncbi:MAG: type II secretion system F family protein [Thermodesulfobacteriota bacterium]
MPIFEYRGINSSGKAIKGIIEAEDFPSAHVKLKGSGVYITEPLKKEETKEKRSKEWWKFSFDLHFRPSSKNLHLMTYQLKTLLGAGLPILEALDVLVEQEENHYFKKTLAGVKDKVAEGIPLAKAMEAHPQVFSNFYTKIISTGEASSSLEEALDQLLSNLETTEKIKSKLFQASTYPILMSIIGVIILFFLMTSIVPRVLEVFQDTQTVLPLPTRILISTSDFLVNWWFLVIIAILAGSYGFRNYIRTDKGRKKWENTLLRIPILGRFSLNLVLYRFSKSMETLLKSGLTIPDAIEITGQAIHHNKIETALKNARDNIEGGGHLSSSLKESSIFPLGIIHMIAVGERSGELDDAFSKVSDVYERSIETSLGGMLSLIEPILIVIMGGLVGFIVLSILLPIFEMSQIIE